MLGVAIGREFELRNQLLAEMTPTAFREKRVLGMQFITGREARLLLTGGINPHIARCDAFDRTVLVIQHFAGGKARKNINAQGFGLLTQPAAQIRKAGRIVAVVMQCAGYEECW